MIFEEFRRSVLPHIDRRLAALTSGHELSGPYGYAVAGGKRVRPALTLLVARALGTDLAKALDLACSIELTHCASLVLDDIIDAHFERRGRTALHSGEGMKVAVTTGFTLPSVALHLAARHSKRAAELLTDTWVAMCVGVLREEDSWDVPLEDRYLGIVDAKTSQLFATAAIFGSLAEGRDDLEATLGEYGLHLGRAFQMVDDLVDAKSGEGALPPSLAPDAAEVLLIARRRLPLEVKAAEGAVEGVPAFREMASLPSEVVKLKEREAP